MVSDFLGAAFPWFICSYQLFSYEQKREINSRFERSSIKR